MLAPAAVEGPPAPGHAALRVRARVELDVCPADAAAWAADFAPQLGAAALLLHGLLLRDDSPGPLPTAQEPAQPRKASKKKKQQQRRDAWDDDEGDEAADAAAPAAAALLPDGTPVTEARLVWTAGESAAAPVAEPLAAGRAVARVALELDALGWFAPEAEAGAAVAALKRALAAQVALAGELLGAAGSGDRVAAMHFWPPELDAPVTVVYRLSEGEGGGGGEAALEGARRELHAALGLPLERPLLRARAALFYEDPAAAVIQDVHVGLAGAGVEGGVASLVRGSYGYYHYLQQGVNDKGWGCAYRSLQTLASWFRLNGYTDAEVPTHRAIQDALVSIGDKPARFAGSQQWIGSMEVGFVLDELMGVSFRSLHVTSGPELAGKARELAMHFDTHGTPVMMGGGNLAFTLLGVEWNEATGDARFLILDPHYTGADVLRDIQTKRVAMEGYRATACGWRGADSFAADSFYNLCLPERPVLV